MCMPIILKGSVGGALYLENNLTRGAFTVQRLDVLSVLAAQAGISIENSNLLLQLEHEEVQRNNLLRFFPAGMIARIMADSGSLQPTETDVTAVFADICEFSTWSEELAPPDLVQLLNQYFPAMTDVVFRHEGVLEKYIGDALLAVWGAPFREPKDADNAVAAAVDMQRTVQQVNQRWPDRRPLRVHIGINSGPVAAGNIGSKRYIQYATIGDTTNIASRICDAAGASQIVISDSTRRRLLQAQWSLEPMEPTLVKGTREPLELFRVRWN
jgi:adenylate cyclase